MSDPIERRMDDAARTLREATNEPSDASAATRARILASHRAAKTRAERGTTWMLAAAALLVVLGGSTAWAYWTGRLEGLFGDVRRESAPVEEPTPAPPAPRAHEDHQEETALPVVPAPSEAIDAPSEVVEEPSTSRGGEPSIAPSDVTIDPAERRAYREAHALHFEAHDDAAAIAAWDRYLATYPRGRFALEARYNRALCLVRAGRESEARAALTPFVQGTHGGYRQQEATEILEALDAQ